MPPGVLRLTTLLSVLAFFRASAADEALLTLTGHTGAVAPVAVTPDGQTMVPPGEHTDHTVKVWRLFDGALLRTLSGHTGHVNGVSAHS